MFSPSQLILRDEASVGIGNGGKWQMARTKKNQLLQLCGVMPGKLIKLHAVLFRDVTLKPLEYVSEVGLGFPRCFKIPGKHFWAKQILRSIFTFHG